MSDKNVPSVAAPPQNCCTCPSAEDKLYDSREGEGYCRCFCHRKLAASSPVAAPMMVCEHGIGGTCAYCPDEKRRNYQKVAEGTQDAPIWKFYDSQTEFDWSDENTLTMGNVFKFAEAYNQWASLSASRRDEVYKLPSAESTSITCGTDGKVVGSQRIRNPQSTLQVPTTDNFEAASRREGQEAIYKFVADNADFGPLMPADIHGIVGLIQKWETREK